MIEVPVGVDNGGASCCGYAWTSDSDRDGDGDGFLLCGRIAHSFGHRRGPIPLRWDQTCQGGTRRTERTTKQCTGVSSPTHMRTVNAHDFSQKNGRERSKNQKIELPIKRAPPLPKIILRSNASINMLQVAYTSQRPTRCAPPRTQFKQQNKFCNEARISVLPSRYTS